LASNRRLACLAGPRWLSLAVKYTSDLSPKKIRCARDSQSHRLGKVCFSVLGESTSTSRRNGGALGLSNHWFSWLSDRNTIRRRSPSESLSNAWAWRNAAKYEPRSYEA